jgi:DNA-binding LacI/PurR family transcriptional regulator
MINIRQLAKLANVSTATISRATNSQFMHKVAPETLKKINDLILKHGYTPNVAAKNLSQPKTKTIGVIVHYAENIFYSSYFTKLLAGVANHLLHTDYHFKLVLLKEGRKWDNHNFQIGDGVEGLVVTQWNRFFFDKELFNRMDMTCVSVNDFEEGVNVHFVCEDSRLGGELVAKHFYELNHRDVGVVTGPSWSRDSEMRLKGFKEFADSHGMTVTVGRGHFDFVSETRAAVDTVLKNKVTAIFCCNDNMAYMTIDYLKELGLNCPQDISVVGYDDDFRSTMFNPTLTTVCVPIEAMAKQATQRLLDYLANPRNSKPLAGLELIPVTLNVRNSTAQLIAHQ